MVGNRVRCTGHPWGGMHGTPWGQEQGGASALEVRGGGSGEAGSQTQGWGPHPCPSPHAFRVTWWPRGSGPCFLLGRCRS